MRELLLVRFGEIFLKGLNRPYFMKELVKKIRYAVQAVEGQVWLHDSRVFVSDYTDRGGMHPSGDQGVWRTQRMPCRGNGKG